MPPKPLNPIGPPVSVSRRGHRWTVRFRTSEGQRRFVTEHLHDGASRDDLMREATRVGVLLDLHAKGRDGPSPGQSLADWLGLLDTPKRKGAKRPAGMWPELVSMYMDDFAARSLARENNQRITLGRLARIRDAFQCHPDDITPKQWSEWLEAEAPAAPSRNKLRSLAMRAYKFGMSKFMCETNPVERVARAKPPGQRIAQHYRTREMIVHELSMSDWTEEEGRELWRWRVLTEPEQAELLAVAEERDAGVGMLVPAILGLHGVPGVDIRCARRAAYDGGTFTGRRAKTGGASFSVPIAPAVQHHVERHVASVPDGPMFPHLQGVTDTKNRFLRLWRDTTVGTDFEGVRFHALRATFISTCLARGISVEMVAGWVGHLDTRTTLNVYRAFMPDRAHEEMAKLRLFEAG